MDLNGFKSGMLVEICQKLEGDEYVTGIGALNYLDREMFSMNNVSIRVRDPKSALKEYLFEGHRVSIVDALMRYGKDLKDVLNQLNIREEHFT